MKLTLWQVKGRCLSPASRPAYQTLPLPGTRSLPWLLKMQIVIKSSSEAIRVVWQMVCSKDDCPNISHPSGPFCNWNLPFQSHFLYLLKFGWALRKQWHMTGVPLRYSVERSWQPPHPASWNPAAVWACHAGRSPSHIEKTRVRADWIVLNELWMNNLPDDSSSRLFISNHLNLPSWARGIVEKKVSHFSCTLPRFLTH